jgi:hypothetical protein
LDSKETTSEPKANGRSNETQVQRNRLNDLIVKFL